MPHRFLLAGLLLLPAFARADAPLEAILALPPAPQPGETPAILAPPVVAPPVLEAPVAVPTATPDVTPAPQPKTQPKTVEPLRDIARRLKLPLPLPQARIVVWKQARRLEVWNGKTLVKTYRVALGSNPSGHKAKQGDGRTPEGEFFLCTRNASTSSFHIFLGLSYPALPDARRGVQHKQITWREYALIQNRLASRSAPLWRTRLGGWVGIHGGTGERFAKSVAQKRGSQDWTAGCIALTNREIEEIYAATRLGTPVSVRP